jgi:hypothetical protein
MAAERPILILQMQRMGDLVLTFPLLIWLSHIHPGRPLWVVAEQAFFEGLMPLTPGATYFPWSHADRLATRPYHTVINLSHRPEAARLAGRLQCDELVGPYLDADGVQRIRGDWQLYRTALIHANRHNRYHWADMNGLDVVPMDMIRTVNWPEPASPPGRKAGLFLGASEEAKRPEVGFWIGLAEELLRRGMKPILFGGPAERELGAAVKAGLSLPVLDLCGKLSLRELAAVLGELAVFITPDTGPMHVAAWAGVRVLNLSMGPVNPWETGPFQPGHLVLRSSRSCRGCWACDQASPPCRGDFKTSRTAAVARTLADGRVDSLARMRPASLRLLRTRRTPEGLYDLEAFGPARSTGREAVAGFWRAFFGTFFGVLEADRLSAASEALRTTQPGLAATMREGVVDIARHLRSRAPEGEFWRSAPPALRLLTSHLDVVLANGDYQAPARAAALREVELLLAHLE